MQENIPLANKKKKKIIKNYKNAIQGIKYIIYYF